MEKNRKSICRRWQDRQPRKKPFIEELPVVMRPPIPAFFVEVIF
jgi:hypothetical protein